MSKSHIIGCGTMTYIGENLPPNTIAVSRDLGKKMESHATEGASPFRVLTFTILAGDATAPSTEGKTNG